MNTIDNSWTKILNYMFNTVLNKENQFQHLAYFLNKYE